MHKNNHKIVNYDLILDKEFGKVGTPERAKAEKEAYSFFMASSPLQSSDEGELNEQKK